MIDVPAGHLYLGERIEPSSRKRGGRAVLLDAADLTTHGVVVGMTGSGKTGAAGRPAHAGPRAQGRSREPAAHVPRPVARGLRALGQDRARGRAGGGGLLAGLPTLVLDPKDDLGDLLLTFPDLWPEDFAPWVEGGDPAAVAKDWAAGLSRGIGPERIAALQDAR
jgi:hypothetical protein